MGYDFDFGMKKKIAVVVAIVAVVAMLHAQQNVVVRTGTDSIVRVMSSDGTVEFAKMAFELPVEPGWKVLAQTGEGLKAGRAWLPVGEGRTVPWYVLLNDGERTYGFGVKVQPRAMCAWRIEPGQVILLLDLRAGGQPYRVSFFGRADAEH